jgi:hypothetical protein
MKTKPKLEYLYSDIVVDKLTLSGQGKIMITVYTWYGPRENAIRVSKHVTIPKTVKAPKTYKP